MRLDGTLLVSFVVPEGQRVEWVPYPGCEIRGPCAGRVRKLPDGPWLVIAYFPEGYPGEWDLWPEQGELAAARLALSG